MKNPAGWPRIARIGVALLLITVTSGVAIVSNVVSAAAVSPCGTSGTLMNSDECVYTPNMSATAYQDTFTVPSGVSSLSVVTYNYPGAAVSADIPVASGTTYYVEFDMGGGLGGPGLIVDPVDGYNDAMGANGNGLIGLYSCAGDATDPSCAVLVAGGDGGDGDNAGQGGGEGGDPDAAPGSDIYPQPGAGGGSCSNLAGGGYNGGGGNGSVYGGGGGSGGECDAGGDPGLASASPDVVGNEGDPGSAGQGGTGGTGASENYWSGGSGGGGGYYGGGGGGSGGDGSPFYEGGGGGGGGSSFVESNATNVTFNSSGETDQMQISWALVAPTATITAPASGGIYALNQVVPTSFGCEEGAGGPGLNTCEDSNNNSTSPGALVTSSLGHFTYSVQAVSADGLQDTVSISYTVAGVPTATITSPASGGTYFVGQSVPTSFSCTEGAAGPGIASCVDSNGSTSPGALNTLTTGTHTYTVTATSTDSQLGTSSISYTVSALPAVAVSATAISSTDVFVVGRSPQSVLWYQQSSGGGTTWTGWQSLATTDAASQPAVVSSGSDLFVFFRATDNELHYFERVGSTWGSEQNLGGVIAGNPSAAVDGNGRVIVASLNSAGNVFEDSLPSGGSWSGWTSLAGVLSGDITLSSLSGNVYLLGLNGAGLGWTIEWTAGTTNTWGAWTRLGGVFAEGTTLAGAAYGGTLHVQGINPQGILFETTGSGSSWSAWTSLDGILAATPTLAAPTAGLFMFDVNAPGLLWDEEDTTSWQGWNPLSGVLEGAPVAAAAGANVFVFGLNDAGNLWFREWNGTSFGAWTDLGGILSTS